MASPLQSRCGVSAVSDISEDWKQVAYVGCSICCETEKERRRVLQVIAGNTDPRATTMTFTEFTSFIFVQPAKSMSVSAFDSWRYRHDIRDLDLILHKDADTAQEGLPSRKRPMRPDRRTPCMHFLPHQVGGVSAAAQRLEELVGGVGSQPPVRFLPKSGVSADASHPGVSSDTITPHRLRSPPLIDRKPCVDRTKRVLPP